MKTLSKSIAYLLLTGLLVLGSSCKKDGPDAIITEDDQIIATDTLPQPLDTIPEDDSVQPTATDGTTSGSIGSGNNASNTSTSSGSKQGTTAKKANPLKGYSAPDGSDAENHDGDQYTKNNAKPMPSGGTSIK